MTSKNVGLAVPDWPTTFGYNMFLFPVSKWVGGILFEHTHRLMGSLVGFLTIILAVWLWLCEDRRWVRNLGVIAIVGVILQGILGGLRVTMMKDQIGIFHACVAQAFLALLVFIALVTTQIWHSPTGRLVDSQKLSPIKTLAVAITVAIYVQLALGATMRHQHRDLAILDFPTANGAWIPNTSATALAKINAWRDSARFVRGDRLPNLAANGASFSRVNHSDCDNRVLRKRSERSAKFRCPEAVVSLLGRFGFLPDCPRCMGDLEQ